MFLKFAPAIKSENAGNTFYDQFYCCTFTMFKNHLTLNFAFSLKKNLWEYCNSRFSHDVTKIQTKALSIIVNILFHEALQQLNTFVYSYFDKGCRKKCARNNPARLFGILSIHCSWQCSCETFFCCFPLALANTSMASRAILKSFFEEQ